MCSLCPLSCGLWSAQLRLLTLLIVFFY
jgi:hypothetical protein